MNIEILMSSDLSLNVFCFMSVLQVVFTWRWLNNVPVLRLPALVALRGPAVRNTLQHQTQSGETHTCRR